MIQVPKLGVDDSRMLVIERTDRPGERFEIKIDDNLAGGGFYDLAKANNASQPAAQPTARASGTTRSNSRSMPAPNPAKRLSSAACCASKN